jgi:hypothetical protein
MRMKKILLTDANIFFAMHLLAQDTTKIVPEKIVIKVEERTEKMSQGYNHCMQVLIPHAQQKDVEHDFAKFMKEYNAKGNQTKGEYLFDNAAMKQLSDNPVNVYSAASQQKDGVQFRVFFDLGGAYLNSKDQSEKFEIAERMIHDFAKQETRAALQNQIDAATKIQHQKTKEQDDMVQQDSVLHKKILDAQLIIKQSEDAIKLNEEKQITKQQEIIQQQKILDALKETEAGIE